MTVLLRWFSVGFVGVFFISCDGSDNRLSSGFEEAMSTVDSLGERLWESVST